MITGSTYEPQNSIIFQPGDTLKFGLNLIYLRGGYVEYQFFDSTGEIHILFKRDIEKLNLKNRIILLEKRIKIKFSNGESYFDIYTSKD